MSINISQATRDKLHAGQQRVAGKFAELLQGRGLFFDFVVLMVCDDQQKRMFEADIESRLKRGLIPRTVYRVIPDTPAKCGNGGAIINTLHLLAQEFGEDKLAASKMLLLPAGGYSQRLPQWGPRGKIFSSVPYTLGDASGPEQEPLDMLSIKLMNYLDILPSLPQGTVYVGWSDLLLFFDATGVDFGQAGFTVFAHAGDVDYGVAHAAFVVDDPSSKAKISAGCSGTYPCRAYYEKASKEQLVAAGAIMAIEGHDRCLVDSDFLFDWSRYTYLIQLLL